MVSVAGKEERGFHAIDATELHKPVKNFVFVPTYGFKQEKNGVLQLFNKREILGEEELVKLKPYQHLIGMIMQNLLEVDKAANIEFDIKKMVRLVESLSAPNISKEGILSSTEEIQRVIYNLQKLIDENAVLREKHKARIESA